MSVIANTKSNTITYFEQAMRTQMETQETEARADLKDREDEMRGMQENLESIKAQKTRNDQIVEELRPLCEELPDCTLDPVTFEPLERPRVTRCGHTFNEDTIKSIFESKKRSRSDLNIECPLCRKDSKINHLFYDQSFGETVGIIKRIKNVFDKNKLTV